jgi:LacI family transcriptional regulator
MNKIATIKDIAKHLGISIATVSRALGNSQSIKPETREKVLLAAKELNYEPNPIALSLKANKSKTIGVIVPQIANAFFGNTIEGIEEVVWKKGYHIMICQSYESLEREIANTELLSSRRIDGLIISTSLESTSFTHLQKLIDKNIPLTMFDRIADGINGHKVVVDNYEGAYNATTHLINSGNKNIYCFTFDDFISNTHERLHGYKKALEDNGLPFLEDHVFFTNGDLEPIQQKLEALFAQKQKPDAIFMSTDNISASIIIALKKLNISVPNDVAIAGFSNNDLDQCLQPALTTVTQPCFEMGKQAASVLINTIENKEEDITYQNIVLRTTLHVRESSQRK